MKPIRPRTQLFLKKEERFEWDSDQSLDYFFKSTWNQISPVYFPNAHSWSYCSWFISECCSKFSKNKLFAFIIFHQNVMTWSAPETTFHFGWDSKPNECENWYHFNQKQLNSSVCVVSNSAKQSVNSAMQLHWSLLAVYILEILFLNVLIQTLTLLLPALCCIQCCEVFLMDVADTRLKSGKIISMQMVWSQEHMHVH